MILWTGILDHLWATGHNQFFGLFVIPLNTCEGPRTSNRKLQPQKEKYFVWINSMQQRCAGSWSSAITSLTRCLVSSDTSSRLFKTRENSLPRYSALLLHLDSWLTFFVQGCLWIALLELWPFRDRHVTAHIYNNPFRKVNSFSDQLWKLVLIGLQWAFPSLCAKKADSCATWLPGEVAGFEGNITKATKAEVSLKTK